MLQIRLKLGLKDQGCLLTAEEFAEAEFEEPYRYERVEGRLVVMSPSGLAHNRFVWAILKRLSIYDVNDPGIIELAVPEAWMRTTEASDRMADIAVYLTADEPHPDVQYEMVPDLVFEVVSEGSEERDYVTKRKEYHDLGIREYVIVDPFRKVLTILTHGQRDYVDRELNPDDIYNSAQLPGFELSVTDLPWTDLNTR